MRDYNKYIEWLYSLQNVGADDTQKDLYSKENYEHLLNVVREVLKQNPDASIEELREKLFEQSHLKDKIVDFFERRKMAPGAVITYGTSKYQETIVLGNRQELIKENDCLKEQILSMEEDSIFDLASVSKLFTSIGILKLVEMGYINLNDEVTKYCKEFKNLNNVSIFDLLTFISLKTDERIDGAKDKEEAENRLFTARKNELASYPNTYNDIAPMVLKYVIEAVTQMNYYDFLENMILKELDMNDTLANATLKKERFVSGNFDGRIDKNGNITIRDKATAGIPTDDKARILGGLCGHAGLFSTASDMHKLANGLIENKILSENFRNMMAKNRTGREYLDENNPTKRKYTGYFGLLCHSKNPKLELSEVHHPLSGLSFAGAGWSGTQFTVDPLNKINFFLGSNRSHNRITVIDSNAKDKLSSRTVNGVELIKLPNGTEMINSSRFAWDRDNAVVHPCIELAFCYKILEDILQSEEKNLEGSKVLKLKKA